MGTLAEDLTAIKDVEDTLIANKVARFSYTDVAYEDNDADGVDTFNVNNEQNIPNPTTSVLKVNSTVLDKGYRAQASSITRMLVNHFFGRVSYNLNKINDNMSSLIATLRSHAGTANGFATLDQDGHLAQQSPVGSPFVPITRGLLGAIFGKYLARTWTRGTGDIGNATVSKLVYANGLWVGGESKLYWSEDGKSWTLGTGLPNSVGANYLTYTNGLWVCGTSNGLWWSEDGKSWTQGTGVGTTYSIYEIVYADGLWVCGSYSHGMWWSEDGKNWTQGTGGNTTYQMTGHLIYADSLWVCESRYDGLWWSEDGKSWTQSADIQSGTDDLFYVNGLWFCVKGFTYWSEDGKSWTLTTGLQDYVNDIVYANGLWVCGSQTTGMWWSTDGKSWTQGTGANTTYNMLDLIYADGLWICGSRQHGLWWSEDGKSWTQGTGGNTSETIENIAYANGLWLCISSGPIYGIWWSTDGKHWIRVGGEILSYSSSLYALQYANGIWVCGSIGGTWWGADIEVIMSDGTLDDVGANIPIVD